MKASANAVVLVQLVLIQTLDAFQAHKVLQKISIRTRIVSSTEDDLLMGRDSDSSDARSTSSSIDTTRRRAFAAVSESLVASIMLCRSKPADAACLYGDLSSDCIGVYKVPINDEALQYMDTPEKLKQYAPDLRWVPPVEAPKNHKEAIKELAELNEKLQSVQDLVFQGSLSDAGIELLAIIPRVIVAGRICVGTLYKKLNGTHKVLDELMANQAQAAHEALLAKLGECDVLIGQAMKGDLGALTAAQIQIISDLKQANDLFADFLKTINAKPS